MVDAELKARIRRLEKKTMEIFSKCNECKRTAKEDKLRKEIIRGKSY